MMDAGTTLLECESAIAGTMVAVGFSLTTLHGMECNRSALEKAKIGALLPRQARLAWTMRPCGVRALQIAGMGRSFDSLNGGPFIAHCSDSIAVISF